MADKTAEQRSMPVEDDTNIAASQLSAIVDDELEDREVDLILRRLSRDLDSRTRWERYHLISISDALQGHLPDAFDAGFAARVRQAVEAESPLRPAAKPLPISHCRRGINRLRDLGWPLRWFWSRCLGSS